MDLGLSGKVVLVTGAASGMGKAVARLFGCEGAHVVAADLNESGARETAGSIVRAGGLADAVYLDVTSRVGWISLARWSDCARRCRSGVLASRRMWRRGSYFSHPTRRVMSWAPRSMFPAGSCSSERKDAVESHAGSSLSRRPPGAAQFVS